MFVESGVISRIRNARISHVKVSALRLFHPTVSSVFFGHGFVIATQSHRGEGKGEGQGDDDERC
jgi:predicted acyl esterase